MKVNTTKKQVGQLSPEQQEVMGQLTLDRERSRMKLLAKALGYRGSLVVSAIAWVALLWLFTVVDDVAVLFAVMGLLICFEFHVRGINSRIDALIKLVDSKPS